MLASFRIVVFAVFLFTPIAAHAAGALAIDGKQGKKWGWAIDYPTVSEAIKRAKKECGEKCHVPLTFSGGCAAYAADQAKASTVWGWGRSATEGTAKSRALAECSKRGSASTNCIIRSWGCHSKEPATVGAQKAGRAFVWLDLTLKGSNTFARFCGTTKIGGDDIYAYSESDYGIIFWDKAFGKKTSATFLVRPGPGGRSMADNPIMQRLAAIVKKNPAYANRKINAKYYRDLEVSYSTKATGQYWNFKGDVIKIGKGPSAADLKKYYCDFMVKKNVGYGMKYSMVDVGEF